MKKVMYCSMAACVLILSAASCKKDYTCKCTTTSGGMTTGTTNTTYHETRVKADNDCSNNQTQSQNQIGSAGNVSCSIQ